MTAVLTQEFAGVSVHDAYMPLIPLHMHRVADEARRHGVVSAIDLDMTVQVHDPLAVLVVTEGFERQGLKMRLLLCEHGGDLALGRAVDAGIRPALLPLVEVALRIIEGLEAQTLQWCPLRVSDTGLHLALAVRIANPARQCGHPVVLEQIGKERVQSGIVNVGLDRDSNKTLDTFDFDFNKKMNRTLIFELATARFIAEHQDVLLLGPPGTGKSHLAQALGQ